MSSGGFLSDPANLRNLAERLSRCRAVTRFDIGEDQEAWTLAHAFADLEQSFRKVLDDQLPRFLQEELSENEINELLLDIGEEFRHVLYHIRDPQFYRYLLEEDTR